MWMTFFVGVLFCLAIVYLPGYLQLRALRFARALAIACAPVIAVAEYGVLGALFGLMGVRTSWYAIVGIVVALSALMCALAFVALRKKRAHPCLVIKAQVRPSSVLIYLCFSVPIVCFYLLPNIGGPETTVQLFDNAFHLNLIHSFAETGRFSVLQSTTFPTVPLQALGDISYYPAGWHVIASLCVDACGISAAMAENIANMVFIAFVFPMAMCAFLSKVFGGDRQLVLLGAVLSLAFVAFPWGFLVAGPLYANLSAFAFLPIAMLAFMEMLDVTERPMRCRLAFLFVVSCVSLLLTQPNAVFTAVIILSPYAAWRLWQKARPKMGPKRAALVVGAFVAFVLLVLLALRYAPYVKSVVAQAYEPYAGKYQGLIDYIDLGGRNAVAQEALGAFVICGIVYALCTKQGRWLLFPYAFFMLGFWSAASFESGLLGTFFSGFWYNDVDRILASAVFVMIPLACMGVKGLLSLLLEAAQKAWPRCDARVLSVSALVVAFAFIYTPSFILAGHGEVPTAFGDRVEKMQSLADERQCLTDDEAAFLEECKEVIDEEGEDAKVANMPFDGSAFAYESSDMNTLYRHFFKMSDANNLLVRERLNDIGESPEVKDAARALGIKYVLLLDANGPEGGSMSTDHFYEDDWTGFLAITDETPGLEPVLSKGDMRLYRIVD